MKMQIRQRKSVFYMLDILKGFFENEHFENPRHKISQTPFTDSLKHVFDVASWSLEL